jgi:hypothetical protein
MLLVPCLFLQLIYQLIIELNKSTIYDEY